MAGPVVGWGGGGGCRWGRLPVGAKALVVDDPGACPGGQLKAEWAKVMSCCGKMINLSLSVIPQGKNNAQSDTWLTGAYVNFI